MNGQDIVDIVRTVQGQWYYSNDCPQRLDPERYGCTDCSGTVRWAFSKAGLDVGDWTGTQSHYGEEIARGHYPSEIPWQQMIPGDVILMTAKYWENYDFDQYLCHIEIYCGNGTMIGSPSGRIPQEKMAQPWMEAYGCITWMVRRYIEPEEPFSERMEDMQCLINANGSGKLCWFNGQKLIWLQHPDQAEALNNVYKACYGREMPSFTLGSKKAPWATRLLEATHCPEYKA